MIQYEKNVNRNNGDVGYGIDAILNNKIVKCIDNITDDKDDIEKIVALCNELELELCHLNDVIEDYLTDFSI